MHFWIDIIVTVKIKQSICYRSIAIICEAIIQQYYNNVLRILRVVKRVANFRFWSNVVIRHYRK